MRRQQIVISALVLSGVNALAGCATRGPVPTPTTPAPLPSTSTSASQTPGPTPSPSPTTATSLDGKTRKSAPFEVTDTFTDNLLNEGLWEVYEGPGTNGVGTRVPENVKVEGGKLILEAEGDTISGLCFCGPATPDFAYGDYTFELSATPIGGHIPVALLWPDSELWPLDGEIDMIEIPDADLQEASATIHYQDKTKDDPKKNNPDNDAKVDEQARVDFTQPVKVTLKWRKGSVQIFYGDKLVIDEKTNSVIPKNSMHFGLQTELSTDKWGEPRREGSEGPFKMVIESVSVIPIAGVSVSKGRTAPVTRLSAPVTLS